MAIINFLPGGGSGGSSEDLDGIIERTIVSFTGNQSFIGSAAFYSCKLLTTVSFSQCETIGSNAFSDCISLQNIYFPNCTSIHHYAFNFCTALKTVEFPQCKTIDYGAFSRCTSLTTLSFPECTYISTWAFQSCSKLTTLNSTAFPKCSVIGSAAFKSCTWLQTVIFPECISISSGAFESCSRLCSLYFSKIRYIYPSAFLNCTSLSQIWLTSATKYRNAMVTLSNSNAFAGTGITSTAGSIYVPSEWLTSYKAASQWSYFASRIFSSNVNR